MRSQLAGADCGEQQVEGMARCGIGRSLDDRAGRRKVRRVDRALGARVSGSADQREDRGTDRANPVRAERSRRPGRVWGDSERAALLELELHRCVRVHGGTRMCGRETSDLDRPLGPCAEESKTGRTSDAIEFGKSFGPASEQDRSSRIDRAATRHLHSFPHSRYFINRVPAVETSASWVTTTVGLFSMSMKLSRSAQCNWPASASR